MSTANLELDGRHSLQFAKLHDHDRISFEAYMAIYRNHGDHVILAAPTLQKLSEIWEPIAGLPLDETAVQHVYIIAAETKTKH